VVTDVTEILDTVHREAIESKYRGQEMLPSSRGTGLSEILKGVLIGP
jgi:hypothetical protein